MEQFICLVILLCACNSAVLGQTDYRDKIMESLKQSLSHLIKPYSQQEMKRETHLGDDSKHQYFTNSFKYSQPEAIVAGFEDYGGGGSGGSGQMSTENNLVLSSDSDYATDVYNANLGLKGTTVTLPTHSLNSAGLNAIGDFGSYHYTKSGYGSIDLPKQFTSGVSVPLSHYGSVGNYGGVFSNTGYNYNPPHQQMTGHQHGSMSAPLSSYNVPLATIDSSYLPKYHFTSLRAPHDQPSYALGHKGLGHFGGGLLSFPKRQILNTRVSDYTLKRPLSFSSRPSFYKPSSNFLNTKYETQHHLNSALQDNLLSANSQSKYHYGIAGDYNFAHSSTPVYHSLSSNDDELGYNNGGGLFGLSSSSSSDDSTSDTISKRLEKSSSYSSITT